MDYQLHLLETITNNFSKDLLIGSGGFGDVYKAVHEGKEIAVKKLHPFQGLDDKEFVNEFRNASRVHHENVVKLLGYCHESKNTFFTHGGKQIFATKMERIFCFEYMHGGSLAKHITEDSCDLDWPTCYKIIKGTCEGLNHLHTAYEKPILHLDIKPANILLDKNNNAKIADLGLSRSTTRTLVTNNVKGTLYTIDADPSICCRGHIPPESLHNYFMSTKNDIFGLGVLILQLMDGKYGLTHSTDYVDTEEFIEHVCGKWKKRLPDISGHPSHEKESLQMKKCVKIALRCVLTDRHKRPSTKDVVDELKQLEAEINMKPSPAYHDESKETNFEGLHASSSLIYSGQKFSSLKVSDQFLSSISGRGPLNVVIVYAFDCSESTSAWYTLDDGFWMAQHMLKHYMNSCLGYIYPMMNGNTYTSDMKVVDPEETKETGYKGFAWRKVACTKNMASGLDEAHNMISNRGDRNNGVILFFSDGFINKGDFFDGAEEFESKVPVHVFTLGGDEYNQGLHAIAAKSPDGKFHTIPVPERPTLSARFSLLLESIFDGTKFEDDPPSPTSENEPLDVVLVYAFDCTESTLAWKKMDDTIFWMVQKKLTRFENSCMGYIYPMLTPNNYTSDMKIVDSSDTNGAYKAFARRRISCTRNMASGLVEAHKMIRNRGYRNGIILFFSDGLINKGDFFDGAENFRSEVPVHTFTLGGNAYNHGLGAIAGNSPGGIFNPVPVPDRPDLSTPFSALLDSLLVSGKKAN